MKRDSLYTAFESKTIKSGWYMICIHVSAAPCMMLRRAAGATDAKASKSSARAAAAVAGEEEGGAGGDAGDAWHAPARVHAAVICSLDSS
jgi:hypothetical protein